MNRKLEGSQKDYFFRNEHKLCDRSDHMGNCKAWCLRDSVGSMVSLRGKHPDIITLSTNIFFFWKISLDPSVFLIFQESKYSVILFIFFQSIRSLLFSFFINIVLLSSLPSAIYSNKKWVLSKVSMYHISYI